MANPTHEGTKQAPCTSYIGTTIFKSTTFSGVFRTSSSNRHILADLGILKFFCAFLLQVASIDYI